MHGALLAAEGAPPRDRVSDQRLRAVTLRTSRRLDDVAADLEIEALRHWPATATTSSTASRFRPTNASSSAGRAAVVLDELTDSVRFQAGGNASGGRWSPAVGGRHRGGRLRRRLAAEGCQWTSRQRHPDRRSVARGDRAPGGSAEAVAFDVTDAQAREGPRSTRSLVGLSAASVPNAAFRAFVISSRHSRPPGRARGGTRVTPPRDLRCHAVHSPSTEADDRVRERIINVSSVPRPFHGNRGQVSYSARAKGAVNAATRSLSIELASRGLTVNAVAPGRSSTTTMIFAQTGSRDRRADGADRNASDNRPRSPN